MARDHVKYQPWDPKHAKDHLHGLSVPKPCQPLPLNPDNRDSGLLDHSCKVNVPGWKTRKDF